MVETCECQEVVVVWVVVGHGLPSLARLQMSVVLGACRSGLILGQGWFVVTLRRGGPIRIVRLIVANRLTLAFVLFHAPLADPACRRSPL